MNNTKLRSYSFNDEILGWLMMAHDGSSGNNRDEVKVKWLLDGIVLGWRAIVQSRRVAGSVSQFPNNT